MYRDIRRTDCPSADQIDAFLGGKGIRVGKVIDMEDFWRVPVLFDTNRSSVGRQNFTVKDWDNETGVGTLEDPQGCPYRVTRADLDPSLDGVLFCSEIVSATPVEWNRAVDVFVEQTEFRGEGERKEFQSVGPSPDAVGWTPGIPGPGSNVSPSYCPGATPDSGRFSHPRDPDPK